MRNLFQSRFAAVVQNELLLASRRVAPYLLAFLFTVNAVLWWARGVAYTYGWDISSDYNILRNFVGFSFILGMPIFNAVMMGDPVIRDFRTNVDPLIFSTPVSRVSYVLGKFLGNFLVLVCCQSAFALTMIVLQWVPNPALAPHSMVILPYLKHFFLIVVVSHLFLAAVYFAAGTLSRNAKIVYALAAAFYPLYITYQLLLLGRLPLRWATILDPMMMRGNELPRDRWEDAAFVNKIVVRYTNEMLINRTVVVLSVSLLLAFLCLKFSPIKKSEDDPGFNLLGLASARDNTQLDRETFRQAQVDSGQLYAPAIRQFVELPDVSIQNRTNAAGFRKLWAATALEFQLLRSERSLVVILPLAAIVSFVSLPFSAISTQLPPSASFAADTARTLLVFLLGVVAFFAGETMHRDRELRVEPVLWSTAARNHVFLLSKFISIFCLGILLIVVTSFTAMLTQLLRGHMPFQISAYLLTYSVVLVPSLAFMAAACIALNVMLREKYVAYAVVIAISAGLFYLYSQGHNHWLYNPAIVGLWSNSDFIHVPWRLLPWRLYSLALATVCLLLAHFRFQRR